MSQTPTIDAPPLSPLTPGQLLSARERGAVHFRDRLSKSYGSSGPKRSADLITGYKQGWDDLIAFLRMQGVIL